jgi:hypothetical protein
MKNSILLLSFVVYFLYSSLCTAQIQFQRTVGGINVEIAKSIIRTTDGGYAVAGYTGSFGAGLYDAYIVKLDGNGTLQWTRTVGGANFEIAYSIIQTTDGGYAVAGETNTFGAGGYDFYIVKLDGSGTLQWSKTIGGTNNDNARSIIQTTDGGYAVAGSTNSYGAGLYDMYIVKLSSSGALQWNKTIGGANNDYGNSIIQSTDGGYAVAGETNSFGAGGYDFFIVKLDGSGTLQWSKTIGGANDDQVYSIIQSTDGGYAVAGTTGSFGAGVYDMYIVKLSSIGALQWSRTVGGTSNEFANSIVQTTDGGYAVAGETGSFGGGVNFYILKLNTSGTLQWSRSVGGANNESASSMIQTTDGGFAAAGYTLSFGAGNDDFYIVKFDASANTCGNSSSPSPTSNSGGILGSPISTTTSPTPTVTSPSSLTSTGGTVTSICTFVGIQPISNEIPGSYELFQNYPNPFNPTTKIKFDLPKSNLTLSEAKGLNIKLIIYDILGKEVAILVNQQLKLGTYEVEWDASNYPSGVYYYKFSSGDFTETKKMVLIK